MKPPYRMLFLGDRRISWEVLKRLIAPEYAPYFKICGLVSSQDIIEEYEKETGALPPHVISNARRENDALRACVSQEGINLLFSVQYNWVIPPDILDAVGGFAFNLHNAKLPDYKGYNSISHALLNGDTVYEATLHWMVDAVDSGDIAYIGRTEILPEDTALSLYVRSIDGAVGACMALLDDLRAGREVPRKTMQTEGAVFYERDSLKGLVDVTGLPEDDYQRKLVRAVYFPPFNVAWRMESGKKTPVLPEGAGKGDPWQMPPANAPVIA